MIANNSHRSGARLVSVLQLVSTNNSRIERLCALLPAIALWLAAEKSRCLPSDANQSLYYSSLSYALFFLIARI